MIKEYKLDKSFGPVGTIAGVTVFVVGIVLICFSISGLFLIAIGAFVGFSSTSTLIDSDNKKVRFCNNLFGIIKVGKWITIETNMSVGIKQSNRTWRAYSRGSRSVDITDKDFRIILFDSKGVQIIPLTKALTLESAKEEADLLSAQLGLKKS
jgi:hypothetical protein